MDKQTRDAMTPKEVRKLWVEKLRSSEYEQHPSRLRRDGQYCPMGVLCNLYDDTSWHLGGLGDYYKLDGERATRTELPSSVSAWAGLRTDTGEFKDGSTFDSVCLMSSRGCDFNEIADVIEQEPSGLLKEEG